MGVMESFETAKFTRDASGLSRIEGGRAGAVYEEVLVCERRRCLAKVKEGVGTVWTAD